MWKDWKEYKRRTHLHERSVSQDLVHHSVGYCQFPGEAEYYAVKGQRRVWRKGDRGDSQRQQRLQGICNRGGLVKLRHMEVGLSSALTMCAVGEGRIASDFLFRESGRPVHKAFAGFGDRHALWTVGVQRGAWEVYFGGYGVH